MVSSSADIIKSSRSSCLSNPVSVPTWTGRSGAAGAPPPAPAPRPRFGGGGSSSLLKEIQQKKVDRDLVDRDQGVNSSGLRGDGAEAGSSLDEASSLMASLISYLVRKGGQANSNDVVEAFSARVPEKSMPLFKQTLKQIAVLKKGEGGAKIWVLSDDFK